MFFVVSSLLAFLLGALIAHWVIHIVISSLKSVSSQCAPDESFIVRKSDVHSKNF